MASITLFTLLRVKVPGVVTPLLYQNAQSSPYTYNGEQYLFTGFSVQSYNSSDLSLGSTDTTIAIRNTQVLRSLLLQYNDLKKATVTIIHTQPGTTVPAIAHKLVISSATTEGSLVMFTLKMATSALQGSLCTSYVTAKAFPSLPYYKPVI